MVTLENLIVYMDRGDKHGSLDKQTGKAPNILDYMDAFMDILVYLDYYLQKSLRGN